MGLWTRFRLWRIRKRSPRITLGAIPLPSLLPDAAAALKDIYGRHERKGYRLQVFWDVLILDANPDTYRMQFYPVIRNPHDCLGIALKDKHLVRFVPLVSDPKELDELQRNLLGRRTFEQTFTTDPMLMDPKALKVIDAQATKEGSVEGG